MRAYQDRFDALQYVRVEVGINLQRDFERPRKRGGRDCEIERGGIAK
jgi:hypothetical protein